MQIFLPVIINMQVYIVLALLVAFLWGIHPVLSKILLNKFSVASVIIFNNFAYFLAILVFAWFNRQQIMKDVGRVDAYDAGIIFSVAIVASFAATLLYYYVLKDHESSLISALVYSSPIFTLIVAYLFLKERLTSIGVAGVLLIVAGVMCIAFNDGNYKLENFFIN